MKKLSLYLTFCLWLLCMSCLESKSYIRSTPYVSLPTDDSRAELSGTVSFNHLEGFGSIRVWDDLQLHGQAYLGRQGRVFDTGISYSHETEKGHYQLLSGVGRGVVEWTTNRGTSDRGFFNLNHPDYDIDYNKFFVQPTVMAKLSEEIRLGLSLRMNFLHFTKHEQYEEEYVPATMYGPGYYRDVLRRLDRPNARISDLSLFLKAGSKRAFAYAQLGVSVGDKVALALIYD